MPTLTIRSGLLKGQTFPIDRATVIGRGATADLSLADPGVSRRHASVAQGEEGWFLEDLGSANGTYLNGRRVRTPVRLREGDVIGIAAVRALFSERKDGEHAPEVQYTDGPEPAVLISMGERKTAESVALDDKVRLRFLNDIARIGDMVFDESALVSFIADELLALVRRADRAVVLTNHDDQLVPRAARTRSGEAVSQIVASRKLLADVMSRREAVLAIDTLADSRYSESESILALGIRAAISAPMMFQGEIYGVVQVESSSPGVPFHEGDVALVLSLASQVGMALGYARLHARLVERELVERDIALAQRIQQQFLPERCVAPSGYGVAVHFKPALGVSGDFYDQIDLGAGRVAYVIGDVSGKGVSAALYASTLTTHMRYQAVGQSDPGAILSRTNAVLAGRGHEGMFATMIVAVLDTATGAVQMANAGHPPPFRRRRDGTTEAVRGTTATPIGLDPSVSYPVAPLTLAPGDALVLYTDGVIEALDVKQRLFDEARTIEAIGASNGTPDGVVRALSTAIEKFVGSASQSDDITILTLCRN
jgi:sigma-B regulation protein RsbU (phosphoserine phosphatase)